MTHDVSALQRLGRAVRYPGSPLPLAIIDHGPLFTVVQERTRSLQKVEVTDLAESFAVAVTVDRVETVTKATSWHQLPRRLRHRFPDLKPRRVRSSPLRFYARKCRA